MSRASLAVRTTFVAALIGALTPAVGLATPITLSGTLVNPAPTENDLFGQAVSLSNGIALVGAGLDDTTGDGSGRAYIYNALTGALLQTLENPTPALNDNFGQAVGLSGNLALVGAQNDDTGATNSGAAYLFNASTGALLRTFTNPTPAISDAFGTDVAISGNLVLISAPSDDTGASNAGAAYLFDATTGTLLRTFTNPAPVSGDSFGFSVALAGNMVLISAPSNDTGAMNAGTTYLFNATTGALLQTWANPTPFTNDMFGSELALSGTKALIGATQDDGAGFNEGAAYLYDLATGLLTQTLVIPNPIGDSEFLGDGLALTDSWALVGAGFRNQGTPLAQQDLGGAFLFDVATGALILELVDPAPARNDRYGFAVALDGQYALVGAQTDLLTGTTTRPGSVFVYSPTAAPVPEPMTVGLVATGAAFLAARRRRQALVRRSLPAGSAYGVPSA